MDAIWKLHSRSTNNRGNEGIISEFSRTEQKQLIGNKPQNTVEMWFTLTFPQLLHRTAFLFLLFFLIPIQGFGVLLMHFICESKEVLHGSTDPLERWLFILVLSGQKIRCMLITITVKFKVTLMRILNILSIFMHILQRSVHNSGRMQIFQNHRLNWTSWKLQYFSKKGTIPEQEQILKGKGSSCQDTVEVKE